MRYNSKIHNIPMLLKSIIGKIEKVFSGLNYSSKELIVVNYHSTPKIFDSNFEKQVVFFKEKYNVISPFELEDYYFNKDWKPKKCSLLFTFDDGLKNNLNAVKILDKHNIKAIFFIVPDFINTKLDRQKEFYLNKIRPIINSQIDNEEEDFTALSWIELQELLAKGYSIGAHTHSHSLIAQLSELKNSIYEIVYCKETIEKALSTNITSFCSINNTSVSVGKKEKDLIAANYKFHFTTFPGLNNDGKNPLLIKRRNMESFWLMGAVYYALGKFDLKRWKNKTEQFNNL